MFDLDALIAAARFIVTLSFLNPTSSGMDIPLNVELSFPSPALSRSECLASNYSCFNFLSSRVHVKNSPGGGFLLRTSPQSSSEEPA